MGKQYDYLIVGAGLFGATFAQVMKERGKRCLVVEKRGETGGNIATENVEGITVHKYGAHIFHTSDRRVWDYVNRFAEFNNFINSPIANYKGTLYSMPFNMYTFNRLWGCKTPDEARAIIEAQKVPCEDPKNIEEKALATVGRDVYQTLIKGYTEKQWGTDCKMLPAFIIGRLPLRFVYDNNYFNDKYQGIPECGYSEMIQNMLDGTEVLTDTDYFANKSGLDNKAAKTLYTGPIDAFYGYEYGRLEYRSLRFETEILDIEDFQGNAVVNYTDFETPYTRIIEHKHFDKNCKAKNTVITREYPRRPSETDEPYYPINNGRNNALYAKYAERAATETEYLFGGRLAQYKYFDMDDTVAAALELADAESGEA